MLELKVLALRNTLSRLIDICKSMKELKQIHTVILTSPILPQYEHNVLITRLLFFCALSDWGSLHHASNVFRAITRPNLYVYNVMIRAYASQNNCHLGSSLVLYKQMIFDSICPDRLTFPFLVKECTRSLQIFTGRSLHAQVLKLGFYIDMFVLNSFIVFYSACGILTSARKVFDEMCKRDVVSWNSLIVGFLRNGDLDGAMSLFRRMDEKKNIITFNSIITGFAQGGRPKEALEIFHEMQINGNDEMVIRPDKITIASVLSACSYLGAIDHGKWVHDYLTRTGLGCDMVIGTALIDMYGKCGHVGQAYKMFKEMPEKDTLAWTAMISVFALNGLGEEALGLFEEMESSGVKPNQVTFVGLLSACAHSGLVKKGQSIIEMMRNLYALEPQVHHYACMVDILARAGLLAEAEEVIRSMPMKPDVFVWGSLLGGCQMHGNVDLGERVCGYLIDLEPTNHAFYLNLCDIYAKAGRFNDVRRVRSVMAERGIRKTVPGCSMIEINRNVYEFSIKGSPDVSMEVVVWVLNRLGPVMKIKQENFNFMRID